MTGTKIIVREGLIFLYFPPVSWSENRTETQPRNTNAAADLEPGDFGRPVRFRPPWVRNVRRGSDVAVCHSGSQDHKHRPPWGPVRTGPTPRPGGVRSPAPTWADRPLPPCHPTPSLGTMLMPPPPPGLGPNLAHFPMPDGFRKFGGFQKLGHHFLNRLASDKTRASWPRFTVATVLPPWQHGPTAIEPLHGGTRRHETP
jgi:hypothetical protein